MAVRRSSARYLLAGPAWSEVTGLKWDEYKCGRCGIVARYNPRRAGRPQPRPEFCPDCRPYRAIYGEAP